MPEHRYEIRISKSCVDPNSLKVERQDADNFTRFQTRERFATDRKNEKKNVYPVMEVVVEVVRSAYVPNKKRKKNGQPTYV